MARFFGGLSAVVVIMLMIIFLLLAMCVGLLGVLVDIRLVGLVIGCGGLLGRRKRPVRVKIWYSWRIWSVLHWSYLRPKYVSRSGPGPLGGFSPV